MSLWPHLLAPPEVPCAATATFSRYLFSRNKWYKYLFCPEYEVPTMNERQKRQRRLQQLLDTLEVAQAEGKLQGGTVHFIDVRHDHWCSLIKGKGPCDCEPEVCPPERVADPHDN